MQSDRDLGDHGKKTVGIDGTSGALIGIDVPTGHRAGNTVTSWAMALHMATIGGWAWKVCVSVMGLSVVALSITGVMIFARKRRSGGDADRACTHRLIDQHFHLLQLCC